MEALQKSLMEEGYREVRRKEELDLSNKWEEDFLQKEILWKHKLRILWLQEVEKNTKFFHRYTLEHKNSNRILKIRDVPS